MTIRISPLVILSLVLVSLSVGLSHAQGPMPCGMVGTGFTYQGQLRQGGLPLTGTCDFRFALWDDAFAGAQVGGTVDANAVAVTRGLFTVLLGFGPYAFNGDARWLAIDVRCPSGGGDFTPLSPRQALTPTPYSIFASTAPWSGLIGIPPGLNDGDDDTLSELMCAPGEVAKWNGVAWICADDLDTDTPYAAGPGLILIGTRFSVAFAGSGVADTASRSDHDHDARYVNEGQPDSITSPMIWNGAVTQWDLRDKAVTTPKLDDGAVTEAKIADGATLAEILDNDGAGSGLDTDRLDGQHASGFWRLSGNAGTAPGTNFLGTTDAVSLTLAVSGTAALRLEPAVSYSGLAPNVIGGYSGNTVDVGVFGSTIGGGGESGHTNRVTCLFGTVSGGRNNQAGGYAITLFATVGGGSDNTSSGPWATVSGGYDNTAGSGRATVGGGGHNTASGYTSTVGGGWDNTASGDSATIPGGGDNRASGAYSAVGGGSVNIASGYSATISGGGLNTAGGQYATVPGGLSNQAQGDYSFAAGRKAKANSAGCFVWGDSTDSDVTCSNANRWIARASGGVYFYTNSTLTSGVYVAAGGGSWSSVSDRALKEHFVEVDGQDVLARLAEVPITTWNYKSQHAAIRHIGPVAQDFYAAFGVGEDSTHITTIDADGVALAAIQGLYEVVQEKDARIAALEAQNADIQARIAALEALVAQLAKK